ncbi:MAG: SMR family transporter [archaeon]
MLARATGTADKQIFINFCCTNNPMDIAIILLLAGGLILTAGDIAMKKWVSTNSYIFYLIGMAIYLVGLNFLAQSFKSKNIAVASVIFVIVNVATLSIVSWLYFKETLSALQILGIMLGITAIVVLELA